MSPKLTWRTSAIEADLGTSYYIQNIRVIFQPSTYGLDIEVDCKRHLGYAPLVTCVNSDISATSVRRSPPNGWKFTMRPSSPIGGFATEDSMDTNLVYRFKLEVLH